MVVISERDHLSPCTLLHPAGPPLPPQLHPPPSTYIGTRLYQPD